MSGRDPYTGLVFSSQPGTSTISQQPALSSRSGLAGLISRSQEFESAPTLGSSMVNPEASHHIINPAGLGGVQVDYMRRCSELERELQVSTANFGTLRDAYLALVQAVPQLLQLVPTNPLGLSVPTTGLPLPQTASSLPPLNKEDYPNVRYWYSTVYHLRDKEDRKLRPQKDDQATTMYLELPTGLQISKSLRGCVYDHATKFWTTLKDSGIPVKNFTQTGLEVVSRFRACLESEFGFLRLCEHHWKADEVWKQTMPTFQRKLKDGSIKMESISNELITMDAEDVPDETMKPENQVPPKEPSPEIEYIDVPGPAISGNNTTSTKRPVSPTPTDVSLSPKRLRPTTNLSLAPQPSTLSTEVIAPARGELKIVNPLLRVRKAIPPVTRTSNTPSPTEPRVSEPPTTRTASMLSAPPPSPSLAPTSISAPTPISTTAPSTSTAPPSLPQDEDAPSVLPTATALVEPQANRSRSAPKRRVPAADQPFLPSNGVTARAICGREWKVSHPDGTKGEFEAHFKSLTDSERQQYQLREKALKKANKENRAITQENPPM